MIIGGYMIHKMSKHERPMKQGLIAQLLIATSLTILLPVALANTEPPPNEPSNELVLPEKAEPHAKSEPKSALLTTGSRGQMLYENHCQGCHTSVVHVRETHRVRSWLELQTWVTHWANELKLTWKADEIGDVANYLNERYYKFEAPINQPQ